MNERIFKPDWKRPISPERHASQIANSRKRTYTRAGRNIECLFCGKEFYVVPGYIGAKYCSKSCSNRGREKKARSSFAKCEVCYATLPLGSQRKTCGQECRNELVRRGKLGRKNPMYRNGSAEDKARWRTARMSKCQVCPSSERLHQHHVVYAQSVEDYGGDINDPRNSFTVCHSCHGSQHGHDDQAKIMVEELSGDNWRFAIELLGVYAFDYIYKHYLGGMERTAQIVMKFCDEVGVNVDDLERYYPRSETNGEMG